EISPPLTLAYFGSTPAPIPASKNLRLIFQVEIIKSDVLLILSAFSALARESILQAKNNLPNASDIPDPMYVFCTETTPWFICNSTSGRH
ncbi:hypothetical protein Hypma_010784, partial [Hypsizygus marmoreus]